MSVEPIWFMSNLTLDGSGGLLPGYPGFLDPNAGMTADALGGLAARQWLAGSIPWWNPYSGVGMPLAAELQSSALFLPYILLLALPGGMTMLAVSLQWTAGLATWRLLLRLEIGRWPAVAGAAAFELCACFAWDGPSMNLPVAFLPLLLLGLERARAAALAGGGGWRTIAVAVAMSLYAGFPETAYLDGLLALLWAALRGATLPGRRLAFTKRAVGGGVAGLLLAAPLLWPFLTYLQDATLGDRGGIDMALLSTPPEGFVQMLMPLALGLPAGLTPLDPTGELITLWGRAGGYAGPVLALAALAGGLAPGPHRLLRGALLAWVALLLMRIMGVPAASRLLDVVPFHHRLEVFRYASAAWLLPCCILAAYAIGRPPPRRMAWAGACVLLVAGGAAAWRAWPLARAIPTAPAYFVASAAWAAAMLAAGAAAFASGRRGWMAAALLADIGAMFVAPQAAGLRHPSLDGPAIAFLRSRLGLQRFATLGPFAPNYGALFGAASVNYAYLPLPAVWAAHVEARLRPGLTFSYIFLGNFPLDVPGQPSNADILAQHVLDYEALGVRYVLAPPGQDPFAPASSPPGPKDVVPLTAGGALSGEMAAAPLPFQALTVEIGTYAGQSSGVLQAELCAGSDCAHGQAELARAADNAKLTVALDRVVPAGQPLTFVLRHTDGFAVGIYRVLDADGPRPIVAPAYPPAPDRPARVYDDALTTIWELPDPAPYFSAEGGPCELAPRGRTEVDARCVAPATLVRRELMMPGWRARVDGAWHEPSVADELFQAVKLPQGASSVAFSYAPPGAAGYFTLFAVGAVSLLPWGAAARLRAAAPSPARRPGPST